MEHPNKEKLEEFKYNLILKEYEAVFNYRRDYALMRLGALGSTLTILGLVITFTNKTDILFNIGSNLILLIVVLASIRIIGAINRGLFVFGNHINWIETQYKVKGFSSYWSNYLHKSIKDSGSYAFIISSKVLNFSISGLVILNMIILFNFNELLNIKNLICFSLTFITIGLYISNEIYIRKQLDPKGFMNRIKHDLERARLEFENKNN